MKTSHVAPGSNPVVFVQDFMPGFPGPHPPTLGSLDNLTMHAIYGSPICVGSAHFIPDRGDAPPHFCRYQNNMPNLAMEKHAEDDFDEYALERIMLGKWLDSPLRCVGDEEECKRKADIVVVPSLVFHMMLQEGFLWNVKHPPVPRAKPFAVKYWKTLEEKFHRPEEGYTPMIVVHSAFAWDWPGYNVLLHVLLGQRPSFVDRIVLPSTGSNLKNSEWKLFRQAWSDSGFLVLQRRAKFRSLGINTGTGPTLFTMPYPTSILRESSFLESAGEYDHTRPRRIAASMLGSRHRDKFGANWIRGLSMDQFESRHDAHVEETLRLVCAKGQGGLRNSTCGLGEAPNMWTLAANSNFCFEPAGDTLCRSHLYVAVLSGCIPVIFDGGHHQFNSSAPTWWAWRRPPAEELRSEYIHDAANEVMLDYEKFAIIVSAHEIQSGKRDVVQELVEMPEKDPERFASLRQHLDRVAPLFKYSKEQCSSYPWSTFKWGCRDAFGAFQHVLGHEVEAAKIARVG